MKKILKLFKNPKAFFLDSIWIKSVNIDLNEKYDNIFIVSHLGQLHQIEALIKMKQLQNCLLVILYTNQNQKIPKSIDKQYNKLLFKNTLFLLLPNHPNSLNVKTLLYINKMYKELIDKVAKHSLYMLSFENHYSLLANYAYKKNINLYLIDEGTATYKSKELSQYNKRQSILKKFITKILGLHAALEWHTQFNEIFAAFPEKLEKNFKAKKITYFFPHLSAPITSNTKYIINKYNITRYDYFYINQRYKIKEEDYTEAILTILSIISDYLNVNIFIKMHPKDNESLKLKFNKKIYTKKLSQKIILINENEFQIEATIKELQISGVIGLTSSTLVYTPLISQLTKVISIEEWFIDLIPIENNKKGISVIEKHFQILKQFDSILKIKNEIDLKNLIPHV